VGGEGIGFVGTAAVRPARVSRQPSESTAFLFLPDHPVLLCAGGADGQEHTVGRRMRAVSEGATTRSAPSRRRNTLGLQTVQEPPPVPLYCYRNQNYFRFMNTIRKTSMPHYLRSFLLCLMATVLTSLPAAAEEVTRLEPPGYDSFIKPLLTPAEPILKEDTSVIEEGENGGVVLLDERIEYLFEDGRSLIAYHRMYRPTDDSGVEAVGRVTISVQKDLQVPHLILARTIRPDGTVQEVAGDAVFLQTPQYLAGQSIYTDVGEVVIVFPDVKPSHAVEYILVIEQSGSRVPGHFSRALSFAFFWPVAHLNYIEDFPESRAGKLRFSVLGRRVPERIDSRPASGRKRYQWKESARKALKWESGREPSTQRGPSVWMSDWNSWDEVAAWYAGLSGGEAGPELEALVAEWTKGLEKRDDIIRAIFDHVSNDVRYVALEFGIGSLKPRSPSKVWTSQYGDCKDKANLLRKLLACKGIESHMVLVNTEHGGQVDEKMPTYRHFNHAIVAIGGGKDMFFADPTVEHGAPGLLPPQDTARPVLLMEGKHGNLVRIPARSAGDLDFDFDLTLSPDGSLKGWMEIRATDYYGASYTEAFTGEDRQSRREHLASLLNLFFPSADLIDFKIETDPFVARIFLLTPGRYEQGENTRNLWLPEASFILPDLGDDTDRETRYYQWMEQRSVQIRYRFPEGWTLREKLPPSLAINAPTTKITASWSMDSGVISGKLSTSVSENFISPASFAAFHRAVTATRAWLEKPVSMGPGEAAGQPGARQTKEIDLPVMPTGEGQLALVDHLYPEEGNLEKRRAALEHVAQLFPSDPATLFEIGLDLAILDFDEDDSAGAIERIRKTLGKYASSVDTETRARALHLEAVFLADDGRTEEAAKICTELAGDTTLSSYRRSWALYRLATMERSEHPEKAMQLVEEGLKLQDASVSSDLLQLLAEIDFENTGSLDVLGKKLDVMLGDNPELADNALGGLGEAAASWAVGGKAGLAAAFLEVFDRIAGDHPELAYLQESMTPVRKAIAAQSRIRKIAGELSTLVETTPPEWWNSVSCGSASDDLQEKLKKLDTFNHSGRYDAWARCSVEILIHHYSEINDFPFRLWQLARISQDTEPDSPFPNSLITLCEELPEDDSYYWEGLFLRGKLIRAKEGDEKALDFYASILEKEGLPTAFRVAAWNSRIEILLPRGEYAQVLDLARKIEEFRDDNSNAYSSLMKAVRINIAEKNYDEAFRLIELFGEITPDLMESLTEKQSIEAVRKLAADPERARAWWDQWPAWEEAVDRLRQALDLPGIDPRAEGIGAYSTFFDDFSAAVGEKDSGKTFGMFFRLVGAAMSDPDLVGVAGQHSAALINMKPELEDDIRKLIVAMNSSAVDTLEDEESRMRAALQLTIEFTDWGRNDDAYAAVHAFLDHFSDRQRYGAGVLRIWALLAVRTGREIEDVEKALREQLDGIELGLSRGRSVGSLADIYVKLGKHNEELRLLKDEIEGGKLAKADGRYEKLRKRLEYLKREGDESLEFSEAVDQWMEINRPPYFDFAHPSSLDDPSIRNLEDVISGNDSEFTEAEVVKICLMTAMDASQPFSLRQEAFAQAVTTMATFERVLSRAHSLLSEAAADERFGLRVRARAQWFGVLNTFFAHDREAFDHMVSLAVTEEQVEAIKKHIENMKKLFVGNAYDSAAIEEKMAEILGDTVDSMELYILDQYWDQLIANGAFDAAGRIRDKLRNIRLDTDVDSGKMALRLKFERKLRRATDDSEVAAEMAKLVLDTYPAPEKAPGTFGRFNTNEQLYELSHEEAIDLRLWRLAHQCIAPSNRYWHELALDLMWLYRAAPLRLALLKKAVNGTGDDRARALVILSKDAFVDVDASDAASQLETVWGDYRDPEKYPETFTAIRISELLMELRHGEKVDVEKVIRNLKGSFAAAAGFGPLLRDTMRKKSIPELKTLILNTEAEELVSPAHLSLTLRASRMAGLDSEAAFLEEIARKDFYRSILSAWATGDISEAFHAMSLAKVLGETVPEDFFKPFLGRIHREWTRLQFRISEAELRGDYEAVRKWTGILLKKEPKLFDAYWELGHAEAELGHEREAIAALKTFLEYCHDSLEYSDAEELLKKLQAQRSGSGG